MIYVGLHYTVGLMFIIVNPGLIVRLVPAVVYTHTSIFEHKF